MRRLPTVSTPHRLREDGNWNSGLNFPHFDLRGYTIDALLEDAQDGDNNFRYLGTPGFVTLPLDENLKTIEVN